MRAKECDGINKIDVQEGRKVAWHRKTRVNENLTLGNCWPNSWDYIRKPLFTEDGVKTPFFAMGVSDLPGEIIGKSFADSYQTVTNKDWIAGLQDALKESDAQLESVGTINNRVKRFFSFSSGKLSKMEFGKHDVLSHFFILDSVDKSSSIEFGLWIMDIVCANTARMAHRQGKNKINITHSKNLKVNFEGLMDSVSDIIGYQSHIRSEFERLMEIAANEDDARKVYAGLIGGGEEIGTRGKNIVNRLTELFRCGAGNEGKSRYDIFSGATDYYSHESAGDDMDKQFASSEFGAGNTAKERVFDAVRDNVRFSQMLFAGASTLEKSLTV